jgi:hypothetical protein
MRRDSRWRHIPKRLPSSYRQYLESVIRDAKAKRENNDFVADRLFEAEPDIHERLDKSNTASRDVSDDNRPTWKPYTDYLLRLAEKQAKSVADDEQYWETRRANELLKDKPREAA